MFLYSEILDKRGEQHGNKRTDRPHQCACEEKKDRGADRGGAGRAEGALQSLYRRLQGEPQSTVGEHRDHR